MHSLLPYSSNTLFFSSDWMSGFALILCCSIFCLLPPHRVLHSLWWPQASLEWCQSFEVWHFLLSYLSDSHWHLDIHTYLPTEMSNKVSVFPATFIVFYPIFSMHCQYLPHTSCTVARKLTLHFHSLYKKLWWILCLLFFCFELQWVLLSPYFPLFW